MKKSIYAATLVFPLTIFLCLFACEKAFLTSQEIKEIDHFKKAQASFLESNKYLKELTQHAGSIGVMSEDERNTYIEMLMDTLAEAKSVSDSTLEKIHSELPSAYRSIFVPCIENKLRGFKNYTLQANIKGVELHNAWVDWWNDHYKEFANIL